MTSSSYPAPKSSSPGSWYVGMLTFTSARWVVLAICVGSFLAGALRGFKLLELTTLQFAPPADAPSVVDQDRFVREFPLLAVQSAATMVVIAKNATSSSSVLCSQVREFERELHDAVTRKFGSELLYASYFSYEKQDLQSMAYKMVDSINAPSCTIIKLGLETRDVDRQADLVSFVEDEVHLLGPRFYLPESHGYFTAVTGASVFSRDVRESTEHDLILIDSLTFPVSMLVFTLAVGTFRFMLLPIVNIATVVTTSFHLVRLFAERHTITTLAPSIMMSASVAFSTDYSLFTAARVREEIFVGRNMHEAVAQTMDSAGHTVLISGLTLAVCWFMLCIFPVTVVSSVGVSVGITTLVCVTVNLLLTPALLMQFPTFWGDIDQDTSPFPPPMTRCLLKVERRVMRFIRLVLAILRGLFRAPFVTTAIVLDNDDGPDSRRRRRDSITSMTSPLLATAVVEPTATQLRARSGSDSLPATPTLERQMSFNGNHNTGTSTTPFVYENLAQVQLEMMRLELLTPRTFRLARFVTHSRKRAALIVSCLVLFVIPFAFVAMTFTHSNSFRLTIPRGVPGTRALEILETKFGAGRLNPYQLVVNPPPHVNTASSIFFEFIQERVIRGVLLNDTITGAVVQTSSELIEGVMWMDGQAQSFAMVEWCVARMKIYSHDGKPFPQLDKCKALLILASQYLTRNATLLTIELLVEPQSSLGGDWLKSTRNLLHKVAMESGYQFALVGGDCTAYDVITAVYAAFPRAVLWTSTCVFCLIAASFRSLVVPLRSISSIAMTLFFVYGAATLVYVHGALEWTGIAELSSPGRELHWASPVMLFGVLVGLSLDYDLFLLVRIRDYRQSGFSDLDSIRAGLSASFGVITAAGGIMGIAFGGLLFSNQTVLNEMSFFLVTAIVFDTLIIRVIFVPAVMILLGRHNWWPMELPVALL